MPKSAAPELVGWKWTRPKELAAKLLAEDDLPDAQIAQKVGVSVRGEHSIPGERAWGTHREIGLSSGDDPSSPVTCRLPVAPGADRNQPYDLEASAGFQRDYDRRTP